MYVAVIKLARRGEIKNKFMGYIVPILATVGSLFILYGGLQNPLFLYYVGFCVVVVLVAIVYYKRKINVS